MDNVYCKSDCEFSNNNNRMCNLKLIELQQNNEGGAVFTCMQYVKRTTPENRHIATDYDRARTAGIWDTLKGKLK